jgi:hypothetical protein
LHEKLLHEEATKNTQTSDMMGYHQIFSSICVSYNRMIKKREISAVMFINKLPRTGPIADGSTASEIILQAQA